MKTAGMTRFDTKAELGGVPLARFWAKVDRHEGGCWVWMGGVNRKGYGQFGVLTAEGVVGYRAHRLAYELEVGAIPPGMVLDHLCRNRRCVNPDHLEPVSDSENVRRGKDRRFFR